MRRGTPGKWLGIGQPLVRGSVGCRLRVCVVGVPGTLALSVLLLGGCRSGAPAPAVLPGPDAPPVKPVPYATPGVTRAPAVSLYAIVADPDRFDGKEVLTAGIAFLGGHADPLVESRGRARRCFHECRVPGCVPMQEPERVPGARRWTELLVPGYRGREGQVTGVSAGGVRLHSAGHRMHRDSQRRVVESAPLSGSVGVGRVVSEGSPEVE